MLTDGIQNPKKSKTTGAVWNPVVSAQILINRGMNVFAVGITNNVDIEQLKDITGDPSRVFYAETFDKLGDTEFVLNISKSSCNAVTVPIASMFSFIKSCYFVNIMFILFERFEREMFFFLCVVWITFTF